MTKAAFTINELVYEIGLCRSTIYSLIRDNKLKAKKAGNRTIFLAKDVQEFLNSLPDLEAA